MDYHGTQTSDDGKLDRNADSQDPEGRFSFKPPLFRQRDQKVFEILTAENIKSVIDLGCADCRLLYHFKKLEKIEKIIGVEIDGSLLVDRIDRLKPLTCDYLYKRKVPLHIQIFQGDILQFDNRIINCEAVTLMEVIEHLLPDALDQLPMALFGRLQPKLVIITTPNSEFNVLFTNFTGFRHWDHKFEWSREEFAAWCDMVIAQFPYSVSYDGVGSPPESHQHVGFCTQYAVFRRHEEPEVQSTNTDQQPYELIGEVRYPVETKVTSEKESILNEAVYYLNHLSRSMRTGQEEDGADESATLDSDNDNCLISVEKLFSYPQMKVACSYSCEKLRDTLQSGGFEFTSDGRFIIYSVETRDMFDEEVAVDIDHDIDDSSIAGKYRDIGVEDCSEDDWNKET